ncbi:unnamed protein product [Sphagnum jensenii]|uniref:Uncharacterized protein n=1 Tax=Sphagnum jensenii TaxID=128206 RepID=A0ABP1BVM8_9BRYO
MGFAFRGFGKARLRKHVDPMDQGSLQRSNIDCEDERRVRPGLPSRTFGQTGLPLGSLPIHLSYGCTRTHAGGSQERGRWPLPSKGGPH